MSKAKRNTGKESYTAHDRRGNVIHDGDAIDYSGRRYRVRKVCKDGWLMLESLDNRDPMGTFASWSERVADDDSLCGR